MVPKCLRNDVLSLAHNSPLVGHLSVNKTYRKVLSHFYWPRLKGDVVKYCRSYHTCQVVGKPNQKPNPAPLKPILAIEEPFSRVLIDCVGPLPITRSGNKYLLTTMCVTTRFPEAVPVRNIKAPTIIKALIKFFTFVGLPRYVQSDQGSNFMSGIFQQVMHQLGVTQCKLSAYHSQSQGAVERFHQMLKTMMRQYCFDCHKNWDEGVHLLMFAVHESVQDSLGFSPFELVFGHSVRGPLKLLKEVWMSDEEEPSINMLDYVSKFRHRSFQACEIAKQNLQHAQTRIKVWYDKRSRERSFKPGDKVLALLPLPGHPLQARYHGPYVVECKVGSVDYVIATPDCRKQPQFCHINMLKDYHERNRDGEKTCAVAVTSIPDVVCEKSDIEEGNKIEADYLCDIGIRLNNSEVLASLGNKLNRLPKNEASELQCLILEYTQLFPDTPTQTSVICHDVNVGDAKPVKQHAYRVNPQKRKLLQQEVTYMLETGLIEPSHSAWSSPCLLVPKPDGSVRFHTDFRKVNALTKADTFPRSRIENCIDRVSHAKYVNKFDLLKGYWQVPLTEKAKEVSAFVTPDGLFQYKVMPFGIRNAPATFQRLINNVIADVPGCEAYIDDVIIYSDTWSSHLSQVCKFFNNLKAANLTVHLSKSTYGHAQVQFLGHIVGGGVIKPITAKVEVTNRFPVPNNKKELMRFLGIAGYYR